ncbi:MAG TPA: DUF72 domain-containing protein [Thiobacillaceae bacterium]|nr:DUF72 domain-containing protein [Thiobacillaceae bacterium]
MSATRHDGYVVYVGTRDWRHASWEGVFYPADMPADWRLAFYCTQFSCVWLAAEQWRGAAPDEVRAWLDEVPEGFLFLLEAAPGLAAENVPEVWAADRCRPLGGDDVRIAWFDKGSDLRGLTERVRAALPDEPIFLLSRDNDLGAVERVKTLLELLGV